MALSFAIFQQFVASVAKKLEDLSGRMTRLETASANDRQLLHKVHAAHKTREAGDLLTDSCEVRVGGIPKEFAENHVEIIQKVFEATNNAQNLNFVTSSRLWLSFQSDEPGIGGRAVDSVSIVSISCHLAVTAAEGKDNLIDLRPLW